MITLFDIFDFFKVTCVVTVSLLTTKQAVWYMSTILVPFILLTFAKSILEFKEDESEIEEERKKYKKEASH